MIMITIPKTFLNDFMTGMRTLVVECLSVFIMIPNPERDGIKRISQ